MTDLEFFRSAHVLENSRARLQPLEADHFDLLLPIALNPELWLHTSAKIRRKEDFERYFNEALRLRDSGNAYPFIVYDKQTNEYAGSTRFGSISLRDKRMEIGWTWYAPRLQGSGLNPACKLLLLDFAFDVLHLNRVELKTSLLNLRSQAAMRKLGAVQEGIFRRHMIDEDGTCRDTVYFSYIREEWPDTRKNFFGACTDEKS